MRDGKRISRGQQMNQAFPSGASRNQQLFHLCLVTDQKRLAGRGLVTAVGKAVQAGVDAVELREKGLSGRMLYELGLELQRAISGRAQLLINDRADLALAIPGAGLHLPGSGLPVAKARELIGPDRLLGQSVHDLAGARAAEADGADYVFFGPVYETESKLSHGPPQGLERLSEVSSALKIPVCAIGGVTPERVRELRQAGARAAAAIAFILDHPDPGEAARALVSAWTEGSGQGGER